MLIGHDLITPGKTSLVFFSGARPPTRMHIAVLKEAIGIDGEAAVPVGRIWPLAEETVTLVERHRTNAPPSTDHIFTGDSAPAWNAAEGRMEVTGTWSAPSLGASKATRKAEAAAIRWERETGGITVAGLFVPTDRTTQDRVDQIVKAYDDGDIAGSIDFKAGEAWVSIGESELRAIKAAGAQHIQACFSREKEICALIDAAADAAALAAIDLNSGWPA